jgi:hypothetical protein
VLDKENNPMSFQGHIERGMVVLDQPLPLPDGTPVLVEPIPAASAFWQSHSLDNLGQEQGGSVPGSFKELVGGWPKDELTDAFEDAFHSWHAGKMEKRR